MNCLLSLDIGTTSVKGVLFDPSGGALASASQEYQLHKPSADIVELDPQLYWQAVCEVVGMLLKDSKQAASEISAVGVTSQGETLIVLDKSGQPIMPAIVWLDSRSQAQADTIARTFGPDEVYRVTGQQEIIPVWTATRMLWLKENRPDLFARARWFMLVGDYILYRLTGQVRSDVGLSASTMYLDITTGRWWDQMLRFLGVGPDRLPQVMASGSVIGEVSAEAAGQTHLAAGTAVVCTPMDQICGAVGAGNLDGGIITENTGAALAISAIVDRPTYDPQKRVGMFMHAIAGKYVLLPWIATAGMALRWFRDEFGGGLDYTRLCQEANQVPPGAEGLMFLPYLCGAGCPDMDSRVRGVFWRIDLGHRRGHFVRAILESVAFVLRRNIQMLGELGVEAREVRCLGGAARDDLWVSIKADMLNVPCLTMETDESTALGVAMLAAVGAGIYPDLASAGKAMVRVRRRIEPDPQRASAYEKVYNHYCSLHQWASELMSQKGL